MTKTFPETIAVVVTAYNYGHFLEPCLSSVLRQTRAADEIVVIDDGSTDATPHVMEQFGDRVRYVRTENGGQAAAFNRGTVETRSDLVVFLDADDTLAAHALETVLRHTRADMAHLMFELELIDGSGRSQGLHPGLGRGPVQDNRPRLLNWGSFPLAPTSGNVFTRAFLDAAMPMPEPRWRISADCYLIRAAALFGRSVWLREVLGAYRMHFMNNYARLVPGGWDPGLQLSNRADVVAALSALAEAPDALLGPEAASLREALVFRAEALQSDGADQTPLPLDRFGPLLAPRYLPIAVMDQVVRLDEAPDFAAGLRPRPGVTDLDLALPAAAGPLSVEFEILPDPELRPIQVLLDGTHVATVPPEASYCEISLPARPYAPPGRAHLRFETGSDEVAPQILAFQISDGRAACHPPLLPGPARVSAAVLEPGLQRGAWSVRGGAIALNWSGGETSFSAPAPGRYTLVLGLTSTPAKGWITLRQEGTVIFQGSLGRAAEIAVGVTVPESCVVTLAAHFLPDTDAALQIDHIALRPAHGVPQLSVGEYLTLAQNPRATAILGPGWSQAPDAAPHMVANEALLAFSLPPRAAELALELDLEMSFPLPDGQVALLGVSYKGEMLARAEILGDGRLTVPLGGVPGHGRVELILHNVVAGSEEAAPFAPVALRGLSVQGQLSAAARGPAVPPNPVPPHERWLDQARSAIGADPGPERSAALSEARAGLVELMAGADPALSLILIGDEGLAGNLVDLAEAARSIPASKREAAAIAALADKPEPGARFVHALTALLTMPAHAHPFGGDLSALPEVFSASPKAIGRYLGAAPELVSQADHEAYRSYLDQLFAACERALAPGPGQGMHHALAAATLRHLRTTRTIFGDGNLRDLFARHGRLLERLLVGEGAQLSMPPVERPGLKRLRVGVLVRDVNASPEGWALLGMYGGLDPDRFERVLIRLNEDGENCPDFFDSELRMLDRDSDSLVAQIRALELDIFVAGAYARDMEIVTAIYAHKLAPLQFWHGAVCPTTSGLSSFDGVFTSAVMEPAEDPQAHYVEPIHWIDAPTSHAFGFPPPTGDRAGMRAELNLTEDSVLFVSTALSHKLLDPVLAAWGQILQGAPEAVLALAPFAPNWSMAHDPARFQDRLVQAGLPPERVHILPPLTQDRVGDLLAAGDLFLDSFPYTGSTTICEALVQGTPALAVAGKALRQLTAASWLRAYGLDDLVVETPEDYVATALRYAEDQGLRADLRQRVAAASEAIPPPHDDRETYGAAYGQALWQAAERSGFFPGLGASESPARSLVSPKSTSITRRVKPRMLAILASPRSGSTLLCAVLNRTPGVLCHFELFHKSAIQYATGDETDPAALQARDADPRAFLDRVQAEAAEKGVTLLGFKHFQFMTPAATVEIVEDREMCLLHLSRENLLAQYSSSRIAEITGQWAAHKARQDQLRIPFVTDDFKGYLRYRRRLDVDRLNQMALSGRSALMIEYTQLHTAKTRKLISELIGIHIPDSAQPDIHKQNSPDILDRFSNPDEVMAFLRDQNLEHWVREDLA